VVKTAKVTKNIAQNIAQWTGCRVFAPTKKISSGEMYFDPSNLDKIASFKQGLFFKKDITFVA